MTQKDYILIELKELNSSLINLNQQNVYNVPVGYFEGLATQVIERIKLLENEDSVSPILNSISKESPYTVPTDYFNNLPETVMNLIRNSNDYLTAAEELETLSPLLGSMKKEMPFTVPEGYFNTLSKDIVAEENKPSAKIISIGSRKWYRYAAAAVVTGLIVLSGFLYFGKNNSTVEPGSKVMANITKDIKNMNVEEQNDLFEFIDTGLTGKESAQSKPNNKSVEIQDLLVDISDAELKDFQEQSEDIQAVLLLN